MIASSSGWTPLFLNAEPHRTGVIERSSVHARIAARRRRGVDLLVLEERHHDVVVVIRDGLDEIVARGGGGSGEVVGDLVLFPRVADRVGVADRLALDEVDDPLERVLGADRQLDRHGARAQAIDDRLHRGGEVGADAVHLVDEDEARHLRTCRPGARRSPTAAARRRRRRTARPRRRARGATARPRP